MERQCIGPSAARLVTPTPPHDRPRQVCAWPRDPIARRSRTSPYSPWSPSCPRAHPGGYSLARPACCPACGVVACVPVCGCACPSGGGAGGMTTASHARGLAPPPCDGGTRSRAGGARRAASCRAAERVGALDPSCGAGTRAQRQGRGGSRCSERLTVRGDTHQQMFVGTGGALAPGPASPRQVGAVLASYQTMLRRLPLKSKNELP
jgi:hypothetical protein